MRQAPAPPSWKCGYFWLRFRLSLRKASDTEHLISCAESMDRLAGETHLCYNRSWFIELCKEGYDEAMYKNSCRS